MDLEAYAQIDKLTQIAEENGIDVPRLRGYRLMSQSEPFTEEQIENEIHDMLSYQYRRLEDISARMFEDAMAKDIRAFDADESCISLCKDYIYSFEGDIRKQCKVYNKYCGRDDVLMIHSRMGGKKYKYKDKDGNEVVYDLTEQPWFLDHVYDAYDPTYCDIYAKIKPIPKE